MKIGGGKRERERERERKEKNIADTAWLEIWPRVAAKNTHF